MTAITAFINRSTTSARSWFVSLDHENRSALVAYTLIIVLIGLGALLVTPNFLAPTFLLQQLRQASFLGIIAAGQMAVILTGNIDLSVSWTLNLSAVVATAIAAGRNEMLLPAIAIALGIGAVVGLINGIGVAYLRIPSMVLTLGTNTVLKGIMVFYTGSAPQFQKTPDLLSFISIEIIWGVIPISLLVWAVVSIINSFVLHRSLLGRKIYAVGNNELAANLSGIRTSRVLVSAFVLSGVLNALAGLLIAGNAGRSFNEMGEPYLLPAIAAVVIGGTSILGGSGKYIGTIAGVLIIRLLDSGLSVMQVPPAARSIIFGLVILTMLFIYGRADKSVG